jgi:pilus assembly protein CpaF
MLRTDPGMVRRFRPIVAERLARQREAAAAAGRPLSDEEAEQYANALINEELRRFAQAQVQQGHPPLDPDEEDELAQAIHAALFGLGRLEPLLSDPEVENIDANGCDQVFVELTDGTTRQAAPITDSDRELVELLQRAAARYGPRRFDLGCPQLDLRLPDGSRLSAVMDVSHRPVLSIRRHRFRRVTLDDLQASGMVDSGLRRFLAALVTARKNVVIAGGTNAGKTTLLRALASQIPPDERLVTIENSLELGLHEFPDLHPNVVALEARLPNVEGEGQITLGELVQRSLRMNPSRVIVGEVLGDEVLAMLEAMSQGNDGSMCTIHASSSALAFRRMAMYAQRSAMRLPVATTYLMIAGAVDFVVFIGKRDLRAQGGQLDRYVASVREVIDADGETMISNEVFSPGPDGRAVPAAPPRCLVDLRLAGYDPDGLGLGLARLDGAWRR